MAVVQGLLGLVVFVGVAFVLSEDKPRVPWRAVAGGLLLQFVLAVIFQKVPVFQDILLYLNKAVVVLDEVTREATSFLFGYLAGGKPPFEVVRPEQQAIVAFRVLPLIVVVSALSAVLFYWGVLPAIIRAFAKGLRRVFRVSGALGFGAASTIFLGTIEAPLLVKPYLQTMKRGELLALMSCTMATIAGTVMVLYANVVGQVVDNALGHMVVASVISVPAALALSLVMVPPQPDATPEGRADEVDLSQGSRSTFDALVRGTLDGVQMVIQIVAIIIVLFAIIYLLNRGLAFIPSGEEPWTVQNLLGWLLTPAMWRIGIGWTEASTAGELMGVKIILNEFVAYLEFGKLGEAALSERSETILTYALCGFANFGSLGIVVGGLGSVLPDRREEIAELAMKSVLIGNLATLMTGAIIGLIY